jgi:hypothetical protein
MAFEAREMGGSPGRYRPLSRARNVVVFLPGVYTPGFMLAPASQAKADAKA